MKQIMITLLLPLVGTATGAAMVFLLRESLSERLQKTLMGFAAGVMIAASVWSLLIPSIEMTRLQGGIAWFPALIGFLGGIAFLLLLDQSIPHLHQNCTHPEGFPITLPKTMMMLFAVTLHNVPEGMAVGVACAGTLSAQANISVPAALALSMGIAIQNFPEGAIISMPLRAEGMTRRDAFVYGVLSGVVEPIAGVLTIAFVGRMVTILPYLLAFAAGAMLYVVIEELIPESQDGKHSDIGTIGAALGFALMMVMDVALG